MVKPMYFTIFKCNNNSSKFVYINNFNLNGILTISNIQVSFFLQAPQFMSKHFRDIAVFVPQKI